MAVEVTKSRTMDTEACFLNCFWALANTEQYTAGLMWPEFSRHLSGNCRRSVCGRREGPPTHFAAARHEQAPPALTAAPDE